MDARLLGTFDEMVPVGQLGQPISDQTARRVEESEKDRLLAEVREGLAYMTEVYADTARDWRSVDAEGWLA